MIDCFVSSRKLVHIELTAKFGMNANELISTLTGGKTASPTSIVSPDVSSHLNANPMAGELRIEMFIGSSTNATKFTAMYAHVHRRTGLP